MKKNGFTLAELLAVIAILAILVILVIPNVLKLFNESKIKTNTINILNIDKIARQFYFQNNGQKYDSEDDIYNLLDISGKKPDEAEVFIKNGDVAIAAIYDNYCFKKTFGEKDITYNKIENSTQCYIYPKITDSTPGILAGKGKKNDPYKIESIEDLVALANYINSEKYLKNTGWYSIFYEDERQVNYNHYIVLVNDLDIKSKRSYVNYKDKTFGDINGDGIIDTIYEELNKNAGLPCINPKKNDDLYFYFDGNNKTIKNLYANIKNTDASKDLYVSLFGSFDGNFHGTHIKDLKLEDVNYTIDTAGNAYVSPLLTTIDLYSSYQIRNIVTSGNIKVKCDKQCNVGGAFGNVSTYGSGIGGRNIVNNINSTVNITVEGGSANVGGISATSSNYGALVQNSYYNGNINVNVKNSASVGGINGSAQFFRNVNNIVNSNINVTANKANIYGLAGARITNNSAFYGNITSNTYQVSTIGGLSSGKITNSYVNANIINNSSFRSEWPVIAGISTKGDVSNSYFIGNIEFNNKKVSGSSGPTSLVSLVSGNCSNITNSFTRGTIKNTQASTYSSYFGFLKTNNPDSNKCIIDNSYYTNDTTYTGNSTIDDSGKIININDIKNNKWFEDTLNLKTAWQHKQGIYPMLYACKNYNYDNDSCDYDLELLPNQKEIIIK